MQVNAAGRDIKLDKDGFPDMSCFDVEQDPQVLHYEGVAAANREKLQQQGQSPQQQPSSNARTPFAAGRPQHDDRY